MQTQEQLPSEEIYDGQLIRVRIQPVSQPSGGTRRFEVVEHPGGVAVVALRYDATHGADAEPQVVLVHQQRPAIGKKTWEIPAGMVEINERDAPQLTAERELREETGYLAHRWQRLIREYTSPGFSTEAITIYLATDVYPAPGASVADTPADPSEIAEVRWMALSEALALCQSGEIDDGKTLLGLYLAYHQGVSHFVGNASSLRQRVMRLLSRRSLLVAVKKRLRSLHWPRTETGHVSF